MFFYAFGSLLFALAMASALIVMAADFAQYRHAMMKALRGLTLDGLDPAVSREPHITPAAMKPARSWSQAAA